METYNTEYLFSKPICQQVVDTIADETGEPSVIYGMGAKSVPMI